MKRGVYLHEMTRLHPHGKIKGSTEWKKKEKSYAE